MPWSATKEGTLPSLKNKPLEIRQLFSKVANEALASGKSEEYAIRVGLSVVSAEENKKKKLAAFRDSPIRLSSCGVVNTTNNDSGLLMLIINPTLSAPLTYATNGKISEGTATNQTVTATGHVAWVQPAGTASQSDALDTSFYSPIAMNIDDTSDEYVLAYMSATANQTVFGTITVKQL